MQKEKEYVVTEGLEIEKLKGQGEVRNERIDNCESDIQQLRDDHKSLEAKFDKFLSNDFHHVQLDIVDCKETLHDTSEEILSVLSFVRGQLYLLIPVVLAILGVLIDHIAS